MKTSPVWSAVLGAALLFTAGPAGARPLSLPSASLFASAADAAGGGTEAPDVLESDWSGPRIGFMVAPGDAGISRRLEEHGLGNIVSEFGWHFEHRITPVSGGPQLLTELTPLVGGVEYGKFVPTITLSIGVRSPGGYEVGMGPSATLGAGEASVGLAIAAGRSIDYGGVRIPLNLAVSTNPKGTMISVLAGYAIRRAGR
jgi:hypothetical protein